MINTKPKPVALPSPPRVEAAVLAMTEMLDPETELNSMLKRRDYMVHELGLLDSEIERLARESLCGLTDDTQDVETYDGTLGVTRAFVDQHETPVGQLQWLNDLNQRFNNPGDSPGNVSDVRWGSGGLFADDLFITAGHCFEQNGGGWERPRRNGFIIEPEEIAQLMKVNFRYQVNGNTGATRSGESFPVLELLEYKRGGLDYAIIRLGRNSNNQLPGQRFGTFRIANNDLTNVGAMLCMIQHPAGSPKKVEAGPLLHNISGQIAYDSLDTLGGSSGASILSESGELVGVHTNGGCSAFSGFNYGVSIGAIKNASAIL